MEETVQDWSMDPVRGQQDVGCPEEGLLENEETSLTVTLVGFKLLGSGILLPQPTTVLWQHHTGFYIFRWQGLLAKFIDNSYYTASSSLLTTLSLYVLHKTGAVTMEMYYF